MPTKLILVDPGIQESIRRFTRHLPAAPRSLRYPIDGGDRAPFRKNSTRVITRALGERWAGVGDPRHTPARHRESAWTNVGRPPRIRGDGAPKTLPPHRRKLFVSHPGPRIAQFRLTSPSRRTPEEMYVGSSPPARATVTKMVGIWTVGKNCVLSRPQSQRFPADRRDG